MQQMMIANPKEYNVNADRKSIYELIDTTLYFSESRRPTALIRRKDLNWNARITEQNDPDRGATPLLYLLAAAFHVQCNNYNFEAIDSIDDVTLFDFNACFFTADDQPGMSALHFAILLMSRNHYMGIPLFNKIALNLNNNFNAVNHQAGEYQGLTPFHCLVDILKNLFNHWSWDKDKPFWMEFAHNISGFMDRLDLNWNTPRMGGNYPGATPLFDLVLNIDTIRKGIPDILLKVLRNLNCDWNAVITGGDWQGGTPLIALLTKLSNITDLSAEEIECIATFLQRQDLNWSASFTNSQNPEFRNTALNLLMSHAAQKKPYAVAALAKISSLQGLPWNLKNSRNETPFYNLIFCLTENKDVNALAIFKSLLQQHTIDWDYENNDKNPIDLLISAINSGNKDVLDCLVQIIGQSNLSLNSKIKILVCAYEKNHPDALALLENCLQQVAAPIPNTAITALIEGASKHSAVAHYLNQILAQDQNALIVYEQEKANNSKTTLLADINRFQLLFNDLEKQWMMKTEHSLVNKYTYLDVVKSKPEFSEKIRDIEERAQKLPRSGDTQIAISLFNLHISLKNLDRVEYWFAKIPKDDGNYKKCCSDYAHSIFYHLKSHQHHTKEEDDATKKAIKDNNKTRRQTLLEIMNLLLDMKESESNGINNFRNKIGKFYIYGTEQKALELEASAEPISKINDAINNNGSASSKFVAENLHDLRNDRRKLLKGG
jgi:hypothetical protein